MSTVSKSHRNGIPSGVRKRLARACAAVMAETEKASVEMFEYVPASVSATNVRPEEPREATGCAALAQLTPSPPLCFPSVFQALANMRRTCRYTVSAMLSPSFVPTFLVSPILSTLASL